MSQRSRRAAARASHAAAAPAASERSRPWSRSSVALLLVSGATALVFETLWVKQLGRVVGVEVHAVSLALSAFFAGLALGGAIFGRLADRTTRPLRLYAGLEAGAAVLGFAATLALARAAPLFVALQDSVGPLAWLLPFALVGLPAFLMGGTLPALLRALGPEDDSVARATGLLYGTNTIGAVLGTLATPLVLVPALGITRSGLIAAVLGLAAAAAALVLGRRPVVSSDFSTPLAPRRPAGARLALALYAIAGGVALGYEVAWSELLVPFLSTRAHAFAVMLATYLAGLAIGSLLFARTRGGPREAWRTFGLLLGGAAATAAGTVLVLGAWLPQAQTFAGTWAMRATGSETVEVVARFLVATSAVVLLPTILLGAAFPAAARLAAGAAHVGRDVGTVAALNTAGGIVGSLLTGFVLIPRLGLVRSIGALAVVGAVVGAIALAKSVGRRRVTIGAGAMVLAVATLAALTPPDRLATLWADRRGGRLLFYEEDARGTVAVLEQSTGRAAFRRLYVQGVSNSGDAPASRRYMRLQALLPLLIHRGEPRSALVVGFGTGITAGALLAAPDLHTRVVAELLPSVVRAGSLFSGNFGAATDARLDIHIGDGRQELRRQARRYDVITLEPPPPSAAGVVNLYSRDFYELARTRLEPDGLMAQWWPLPAQNDEDSRSLVRSFLDVFPYAAAWTTELHEVLLVGSATPIELDGERVERRWAQPSVAAALAEVGIESAAALLATWVTDRAGLERYAGDARPVTDDRPRIEHAAWVRRGEIQRVLPRLLDLASDVPLRPGDPLRAQVDAERKELLGFYRFSLDLMAGRREEAHLRLRDVLAHDPRNPYYLWVAYGEE